jgi:hypothetical protein
MKYETWLCTLEEYIDALQRRGLKEPRFTKDSEHKSLAKARDREAELIKQGFIARVFT